MGLFDFLFDSDIDYVCTFILDDQFEECRDFLTKHPDIDLNNYSGLKAPLFAALSGRKPEFIVLLLEHGASMHFPIWLNKPEERSAESAFIYCLHWGDTLGVPLFLFHEQEELPSNEIMQEIRLKLCTVYLSDDRKNRIKVFDTSVPKAKRYRAHLKKASQFEAARNWLSAVTQYQLAIKLLEEQRDISQYVPYLYSKRPVCREIFFEHYSRKMALYQARIVSCFLQLSEDTLPFDDDKLREWLSQIADCPITVLQGRLDNQFSEVTQNCIRLFDRWGKAASIKEDKTFAQQCFHKVADLYIQLGERLSDNIEQSSSFLQLGAQYHAYADSLIPDSPRSEATTVAYKALIQKWHERGCLEQTRAYMALLDDDTLKPKSSLPLATSVK